MAKHISNFINKRRIIIMLAGMIIMGLALLVVFLSIFSKKNEVKTSEVVELNLVYAYQNAQWHQGIQSIVEAFQNDHENILIHTQVQYEDKVYEDILYKLQARGELGDIIQMKNPERYAAAGLLAPIDEVLGDLLENAYYYGDQLYALEALESTNGILYNRDIFEQYGLSEPETYQAFLELCSILQDNGETPIGVAGGDLWHMEFWVNHFFRTDVLQTNLNWLTDRNQGLVSWLDEEPRQMLEHLQQLFTSGYVNSDWAVMRDGNLAYVMSQGQVVMIYTGSWTAKELVKLNPQMNLGWFYLPDEDEQTIITQNQDVYWSVTAACGEDTDKYQAAMCFLEFFYQSDVYGKLCSDTFGFPVTIEKYADGADGIQLEIQEKFLQDELHLSDYIGNDPTPQGFEKQLLYQVIDLAKGEITVDEVAQILDQFWDNCQE